jgi:pimeloyl-ACP methyl ester carboxylesterase
LATYVLIHGGGHGGWCYQRLARLLRRDGHEVYTPTLTGLGERSHLLGPQVDLNLHVQDVVSVMEYEDLHDVILVGHSYGGMVITGAADLALDRVARLVYLDAAVPANGDALIDTGPKELLEAARAMGRVVDGIELVLFPDALPMDNFGVTDPDDVAWMLPKLTPQPWKTFDQPLHLTNEEALRAVPDFHIMCEQGLVYRPREFVERIRGTGRLWTIDTGHDLMITEPEAVADALIEVAAR